MTLVVSAERTHLKGTTTPERVVNRAHCHIARRRSVQGAGARRFARLSLEDEAEAVVEELGENERSVVATTEVVVRARGGREHSEAGGVFAGSRLSACHACAGGGGVEKLALLYLYAPPPVAFTTAFPSAEWAHLWRPLSSMKAMASSTLLVSNCGRSERGRVRTEGGTSSEAELRG